MARPHHALALILTAAVLAVGWQILDWRAHRDEHLSEHHALGRALLNAVDGVAARECRGGSYDPKQLQRSLEETRTTFGLKSTAIAPTAGPPFVSVGDPGAERDPLHTFAKEFAPARPVGRGPPWAEARGLTPLPESPLTITVTTSPTKLNDKLADDLRRALVTCAALLLAIGLFAGVSRSRTRAVRLRAELDLSQSKLEGLETLSRLGAGLAHETKNPLGVIRGFAERIARGNKEQLTESARAIVEETDRTVARLDEFLLLSRPAALRRERVDVKELFAQLQELLHGDLESKRIQLNAFCEPGSNGPFQIDVDRDQVRRLLLNLLLNAIHACDAGGHIDLRCGEHRAPGTSAAPSGWVIRVEDDGAGVPDELRDTMFEPYVSGAPAGTGLGLAIARRIAADHGFKLRYEPRAPRGTAMVLES